MHLQLSNINKISSADVKLNGLTVIAGANDTGKSTVGKVLFSVIKAISGANGSNEENRRMRIKRIASSMYIYLHNFDESAVLFKENEVPNTRDGLYNYLYDIYTSKNETLLAQMQESLYSNRQIVPMQKSRLVKALNELKNILEESKSPLAAIKKHFDTQIEGEFLNKICTIGATVSDIYFEDNDHYCQFQIERNKTKDVKVSEIRDFPIYDATFVESPLYIHFLETFANAHTLEEGALPIRFHPTLPYVHSHVKDFANKLYSLIYLPQERTSLVDDALEGICEDITGGKFVADKDRRKIYWEKDGVSYSPVNVASGIKSFGVIQILKETNTINDSSILIWDEPENHLHPEWQIEFAKLLVETAKEGVPVLVTSHSPYFIQAIRFYSVKEDMKDFTYFYMAQEDENALTNIIDATTDLNMIFSKLAQPMGKIINLQ